jgi:hypothetical protein
MPGVERRLPAANLLRREAHVVARLLEQKLRVSDDLGEEEVA